MTIIKHLNHGIQQWLPLPLPPPHPARLRLQSPPRPHFRLRLCLGLPLRSPRSLPRTPPRPRPRSPPPLPPLALSKTPPPRDGTPLSAPTPPNARSPPVDDGRPPARAAVAIVVVGARPSAPPIARTPTFVPRRQPSPHAGHRASSSSSSRACAIVGRLLVPHARGQRRLPQRGLRRPSPAAQSSANPTRGHAGPSAPAPRERADGRPPCRRSPPRARDRG